MESKISFKDLLSTGAHFGHVTRKWHPNYEPYILMERNGVHIINLEETVNHLSKAIEFVNKVVEKNGEILFVGTKKQAQDIVQQEADRCGMYYVVERWLGGTLTNFSTIKKSIKRLKALEKEGSSIYENLTKKEIQMLNRERLKLSDQHRGIKDMRRLPDAIVIVDVDRERTALEEAIRLEIPVIAIVDTNCDPRIVDYPIPANDDSIRTIQIILSAIVDSILEIKGESVSEEVLTDTPVEQVTTEVVEEITKKTKSKNDTAVIKLEGKESTEGTSIKKVGKKTQEVPKEVKKSVNKTEPKPEVKKVDAKPSAKKVDAKPSAKKVSVKKPAPKKAPTLKTTKKPTAKKTEKEA